MREGAIQFSQFSTGWQRHLYLDNPFLDPDKTLREYSAEEWEILRSGTKEPLKIEMHSDQTGRVDRVDYEGSSPIPQALPEPGYFQAEEGIAGRNPVPCPYRTL